MQAMIRIIDLERSLIKIFSLMIDSLDSLFEGIYKATSARGPDAVSHKIHVGGRR